jgi:hypothetical protein
MVIEWLVYDYISYDVDYACSSLCNYSSTGSVRAQSQVLHTPCGICNGQMINKGRMPGAGQVIAAIGQGHTGYERKWGDWGLASRLSVAAAK